VSFDGVIENPMDRRDYLTLVLPTDADSTRGRAADAVVDAQKPKVTVLPESMTLLYAELVMVSRAPLRNVLASQVLVTTASPTFTTTVQPDTEVVVVF
jgi:hypothetical protein